ncbi:MAG: type I-A CRISPR-associated protein Cas7/Csa2 [Desulfurococcaceae archaeon]|nr:type I-A CRISPR-associated protein Cas7/Csa2 [Desulfurococcaceae archaeon]
MISLARVHLSVSARILVNAEALNMAETVGNVSRHRRAPVIVESGAGYSLVYVPAVSGESLAHSYQVLLAQIADSMNLPVTEMDRRGFFLKFSDDNVIQAVYSEVRDVVNLNDPCEIEKKLLKASCVADVAGFLYTKRDMPIKRTSRVRFGYLVPAVDALSEGAAATYPQLHVRYAPPNLLAVQPRAQPIYYVESGSSLYVLTASLAVSDIGGLEYCRSMDEELEKQRILRIEAALKALVGLVDGLMLGAKRSRYKPVWEVRSLIASVSKGPIPFEASPGSHRDYIAETSGRARVIQELVGVQVELYAFDREGLVRDRSSLGNVRFFDTHSEALAEAVKKAVKLVEGKSTK